MNTPKACFPGYRNSVQVRRAPTPPVMCLDPSLPRFLGIGGSHAMRATLPYALRARVRSLSVIQSVKCKWFTLIGPSLPRGPSPSLRRADAHRLPTTCASRLPPSPGQTITSAPFRSVSVPLPAAGPYHPLSPSTARLFPSAVPLPVHRSPPCFAFSHLSTGPAVCVLLALGAQCGRQGRAFPPRDPRAPRPGPPICSAHVCDQPPAERYTRSVRSPRYLGPGGTPADRAPRLFRLPSSFVPRSFFWISRPPDRSLVAIRCPK